MTFLNDLKFAIRSLGRSKGLAATVVITLALGIGANSAIFTLVRGVLLRPLVNRDEDRLIYIRQSAPGIGVENAAFSVPEIQDLKERVKTISEFGDFSRMGFTMIGLGEPREILAGVVGGSYFEVMGLHPVLGRLLDMRDDGPKAAGAVVLTYRFWTTVLKSDPTVLGKTIRLGARSATIVGVLEPSVPYPSETEIMANLVTSPHHLSATMVTGRVHRMTELFGRLAPGATLDQARAELSTVYGGMVKEHPEDYSTKGDSRLTAVLLRDQVTSRARTVLLVLMAASMLVFVIASSNVANLILARTIRREGELAIRAALGAGTAALRRTLLAESLLLCGAGAVLGVLSAGPLVSILARYASRFSPRALDLTVDSSMVWVGAILAVLAAVLLAFVPRLPSAGAAHGYSLGSQRVTGGSHRRQQVFVVTQVAACFVLLAGASMLLKTLLSMQTVQTGYDTRHVLAVNVPIMSYGKKEEQILSFYREAIRRIKELPGVDGVAVGTQVPWRDSNKFGLGFQFAVDNHVKAVGEDDPRARFRAASPGFFASLGIPMLAGRDFNDNDRKESEKVVVISQSVAQRLFPGQDAVNHYIRWTDPVMKFVDIETTPRRIIGIVKDVDDENVVPGAASTIYEPFAQQMWADRMFVHAHGDPYALVQPLTRIIREMSPEQVVEKAATLEDVRAEVLTPDKLNALVFGVFAAVAMAIAVVGVAGVLAFSVSARTREFGIRLAIGSQPRHLLTGIIAEGAWMAGVGIVAGALCGFAIARLMASVFPDLQMPGILPTLGSAVLLMVAAVVASVLPAARAASVDVMQAMRSD
ncbi:MAG TPA: ADOP family duplicated permease [Bryobacteraceae bacterium]|jgi:putative ABC transport system permease protein|nr:ADOP family duplicated permease [Bryobacteraceae bacterium]